MKIYIFTLFCILTTSALAMKPSYTQQQATLIIKGKYLIKSGIGNWTLEQFIHSMRSGINSPHPSSTKITLNDLKAVMAYLNTIPLAASNTAKTATLPAALSVAATMENGAAIYNNVCAGCHTASTAPPGAPVLSNPQDMAALLTKDQATLLQNVMQGYNNMPAKGGCENCSEEEIKAALSYMLLKAYVSSES